MNKIFNKKFTIEENLLKFHLKDQNDKKIIDFYSDSPFPNYKKNEDKSSIIFKGEKNLLAKEFKKFIGFNKNILEVGCGTGQLALYFAIGTNNRVFALDPTLKSIELGKNFSIKNNINNIKFVNADIFDKVFNENTFDFIWSNGVLHHTKNPALAFNIICQYLKKNGYILVGLYNKFGRLRTILRKFLYKLFGKNVVMLLDPMLRNIKKGNDEQIKSWIKDQYENPVESLHTLDEVLEWFKKNNIEFISSIPACDINKNSSEKIFTKKTTGTFFSRIISQFLMLFSNLGADGGLFVVIGKKQ